MSSCIVKFISFKVYLRSILISTFKEPCVNSTWLMFLSWKHFSIGFKSEIQVWVIDSQGCMMYSIQSFMCVNGWSARKSMRCRFKRSERWVLPLSAKSESRAGTILNMYQSSYPSETYRRWMIQSCKSHTRPLRFNHVQFIRHFQRSVNGQAIDARWMKASWQCRRAHVA